MKKRVLFLGLAAGIISFNANAQLALETFNSGLPATWVMINDGHTVSTSFAGSGGTAVQDSLDRNAWTPLGVTSATDLSMITTSYFSPAAAADRWLITPSFSVSSANTVIQWQDYDLGSGESIELKLSPTAGTTAASFTSTIYSGQAGSGALVTHQVPIGSYSGSSVRIAFRDTTNNNWGLTVDNVQTVILPSYDLGITYLNMIQYVQTGSSNIVTGLLHNYGIATTTSLHINYKINSGTPVSSTISSVSIPLNSDYVYTSGAPWVPSVAGVYTVTAWADQINGSGVDGNHTNDTATEIVTVLDNIEPKMVMIEEFTQASCDPCAHAAPNVDSVYANNLTNTVLLRYHVNFPGRDCMDSVTLAPFVQNQLTFYSVRGVPDAQVDGYTVYPGAGYLTSDLLRGEAAQNSPFKITVTPSFNVATHTYSFSATVTSHQALPAGLKLRAALSVDKLIYAENQSTESQSQTIFPEVAENMFPGPSGTALAAFTVGSSQTITSSWVKNHAWGSDYSRWAYDSSNTGKIIVWIENDATKYVYQANYAVVATGGLSVNAVVSANGSMDIYPNPASRSTTVALNLKTGANVKMEVYNMAGQVVFSMPVEARNSGTSLSTIDVSNFASGEYMVRVMMGNEMLTKKITVTK